MSGDSATNRMHRARTAQALWARCSVAERARRLRPLRHTIAQRMDQIVQVISEEVGKPPMDALAGDVMVTLEHLRFYGRRAAHILRPQKKGSSWVFYRGTRFTEILEPHGVVLVLAPWNYPLQLAVIPMMTALFAGNAVVLKCSEHTPQTTRLIQELCAAAGLPEDLVQVSCEMPEKAAALLEARPDLVFFTGSHRNGRAIAAHAANLMIPTVMELGGKDAAIVFNTCNLQRTVNGLIYGSFSNAGQVCVGTKRIFVQQEIYDGFLQQFVEAVRQLRVGTTIESDMGTLRLEALKQRLRDHVEDARSRGAKLHSDWRSDSDVMTPVVLTNVPDDAALLLEESFGPVVCIAPFHREADAIDMANASTFGLSASVWTGDRRQGERVAHELNCGSCAVNDVIRNIGNPQAAFGGNRASGYGRYHGAEGLRTFSRIKTVMVARRLRRVEMHWFPFRAKTFRSLRKLLKIRHGKLWNGVKRQASLLTLLLLMSSVAFGSTFPVSGDSEGSIQVKVTLPANAHGQIAYLIFTSAEGFPGDRGKAMRHGFVPVVTSTTNEQTLDLGPLPSGLYAVSIYLDKNGNHKLDTNWLGIPKEPVGASNNPKGRIGPPHFDECAFSHGDGNQSISINLVR